MTQMKLIVTVQKDVADRDQGELIFRLIEQRLEDRPDLKLSGHVTNHFELTPEQPPP